MLPVPLSATVTVSGRRQLAPLRAAWIAGWWRTYCQPRLLCLSKTDALCVCRWEFRVYKATLINNFIQP